MLSYLSQFQRPYSFSDLDPFVRSQEKKITSCVFVFDCELAELSFGFSVDCVFIGRKCSVGSNHSDAVPTVGCESCGFIFVFKVTYKKFKGSAKFTPITFM